MIITLNLAPEDEAQLNDIPEAVKPMSLEEATQVP